MFVVYINELHNTGTYNIEFTMIVVLFLVTDLPLLYENLDLLETFHTSSILVIPVSPLVIIVFLYSQQIQANRPEQEMYWQHYITQLETNQRYEA